MKIIPNANSSLSDQQYDNALAELAAATRANAAAGRALGAAYRKNSDAEIAAAQQEIEFSKRQLELWCVVVSALMTERPQVM